MKQLIERDIHFHLLADLRCNGLFDDIQSVEYIKASLHNRIKWYNRDLSVYSAVLCFGNIPAPRKLNIPVYTYFHNINLLTLCGLPSRKEVFKSWFKREVFRYYKENTDYWLVQTTNTKDELKHYLQEKDDRVKLMPFFNIPPQLAEYALHNHGDDYVYVANYTGSKQHEELLKAWFYLHNHGIDKTLHLTVPESNSHYLERVFNAQKNGIKIINHGFLPFEEVINLYAKSKAIVYPSLNESLGLGIIEAITAGCDVIGANLPYTYSVCRPSVVFNPYSADSIANAIIEYEKGDAPKSKLLIRNQIDDLLALLSK